ncbi:hypothetical protein EOA25_21690 [Mesorhizobium sp. M2A.F.Ca.ET.040.01.1.1]|nr:hypothetical protein EOA25_21690 [Mesorhizobium sp. M2A.F.Ca.ET.040.01.1.1]
MSNYIVSRYGAYDVTHYRQPSVLTDGLVFREQIEVASAGLLTEADRQVACLVTATDNQLAIPDALKSGASAIEGAIREEYAHIVPGEDENPPDCEIFVGSSPDGAPTLVLVGEHGLLGRTGAVIALNEGSVVRIGAVGDEDLRSAAQLIMGETINAGVERIVAVKAGRMSIVKEGELGILIGLTPPSRAVFRQLCSADTIAARGISIPNMNLNDPSFTEKLAFEIVLRIDVPQKDLIAYVLC